MKKIWYFLFPSLLFVIACVVLFTAFNKKSGDDKQFFNNDAEEKIVPPPFLQLENTDWTDTLLAKMSLEEKIGQLFMVAAYSNRGAAHEQEIIKLIREQHIGGLIMMQGGPLRQARLTNLYQSKAKIPLLISIDGEWGLAMRLDSTIAFPRQMSMGAIQNDSLIYKMGAEVARQCKRIGVQVNFAPVVDVNNNPRNPVIGNRAFGEQKEMVARKGIMYMKGLQDNQVLANAKHFPGHGDTDSDSHKTLPIIKHSKERIDSLELYPFRRLIDKGLGSIMVAHLYIPSLDSTPNTASTLSRLIVDSLLKKELDFKGLIFTDALNMKGVSAYFKPGELDLKAFLAGNDVLLFAEDVPAAASMIKSAVESNRISEEELNRRVRKILLTKQWTGLPTWQPVKTENLFKDLNNEQADVINRQLVQASLTLIQNQNDLIPLKRLDTLKIASVNIGFEKQEEFQQTLSLYTKVDHFGFNARSGKTDLDTLATRLKEYNLVILNVNNTSHYVAKNFGLAPNAAAFIQNIISSGKKTIVNVAANPYIFEHLPGVEKSDAVIVSYEDNSLSRTFAAQGIFGGIGFSGKLPVTVTPSFKYGMGVKTEKVRLKYSVPSEVGMNSSILKQIDAVMEEGVKEGAFPGAQVLVAKKGTVILNKSYGHHTYSKSRKVEKEDLYDIASLTKIIGTLPALMKMASNNEFNIDSPLGKHLPALKGSNKEHLIIRDILAHQAGLKSWIPFYISTLSGGAYKSGIYSTTRSEEYPTQVAKDLFIHKSWRDTIYQRIIRSEVKPAGDYVYSDLGYYLLQMVVEEVHGQPLNEYMNENFYSWLGMNKTTYRPLDKFASSDVIPTEHDKLFRKQLIHGYVHDQGAAMLGGVAGHAGLFSNANDLAKMMQMYLNNGKYGGTEFIPGHIISNFTEQQFCYNENRRGAGFDRPDPLTGGPVCIAASSLSYGHSGFTGTLAWSDPEADLVYIFLSNRVHPDAENRKLIKMDIRTRVQDLVYKANENTLTSSSSKQNKL